MAADPWQDLFAREFEIARFNLNPGTLGTPSRRVRAAIRGFEDADRHAWPLGQYKAGRIALAQCREIAIRLWGGPHLAIGPGTTLYTNLLLAHLIAELRRTQPTGPLATLTTDQEHEGGAGTLHHHPDLRVTFLTDGDIDALEQGNSAPLEQRTQQQKLVVLSQVRWTDGRALPVGRMIEMIRHISPDAWIIVDAAQVIGLTRPVLPAPGGADFCVASAHKWLCGPPGTGFLWASETARARLPGFCVVGHALDPDSAMGDFEPGGGQDFARFVGLAEALSLYEALDVQAAGARSARLGKMLHAGLGEIFGQQGRFLRSHPGFVTLQFDTLDPYSLYMRLENNGIHVKCVKGQTQTGQRLNQLRFGVPWYETEARVEQVIGKIGLLAREGA